MKIFVSSRMEELVMERKTAIESLHFAGHTPLYIETEPMVKNKEAKQVMDSLIRSADALVSIYYLSEGRIESILNNLSPIYYEFEEFKRIHPEKPIFLFRKRPDIFVNPSANLLEWFKNKKEQYKLPYLEFIKTDELAGEIVNQLGNYATKPCGTKDNRIIIRYSGPDFIGLIGKVSEVIFTSFKMNIDYISHASRGGLATIYLSCSPIESLPRLMHLKQILCKQLADDIIKVEGEDRGIDGFNPNKKFEIKIDRDDTKSPNMQFFVELRTIDAPGQLNAICKVLKELKFNIDELQQKPTPPEYKRQSNMILWLSPKNDKSKNEIKTTLIKLETAIRNLVGVRAFSIRVVISQENQSEI